MPFLTHLTAITLFIVLGCSDGDFKGSTHDRAASPRNEAPAEGQQPTTDPFQSGDASVVLNGEQQVIQNPANPNPGSIMSDEDFQKLETNECISGQNLVFNGDFERGNVGFTTEYSFDNTCRGRFSPAHHLQYSINSTPSVCHQGYVSDPQDRGNMLVVNLPAAGEGERYFWCQDLQVEKDHVYQISVRLRRAANNGQRSDVEWTINNNTFTQRFFTQVTWGKFLKPWRAPATGQIKLCGRAITQNTESGDLIVDDIFFRKCN